MLRRAFHSRGERFALVAARTVARGEQRIPSTSTAAAALLAPLLADSLDVMELRRVAAELGPALPPSNDREVLSRLVAAIAAGRLVLVRVDPPRAWGYDGSPSHADQPDEDHPRRSQTPVDVTHWVEIVLRDENNAGIVGQRYLVITPDGHQHRGYTDSLGSARVTRLPPGPYQVSFPDLDADVCERTEAP
jgi:hypothetical protein